MFALSRLAVDLDWAVTVIDQGGRPEDHPRPHLVRTTLDLGGLGLDAGSAVVVATQGAYDDLALEAALATDAGYVGLVAAEKRAAATLALLRDRGVAPGSLARVHAPAGLDLGPVANADIAVAVLAELVARRATGELVAATPARSEGLEASDPVCGMTVLVDESPYRWEHEGVVHWFCAPGCLAAFQRDPAAYANLRG